MKVKTNLLAYSILRVITLITLLLIGSGYFYFVIKWFGLSQFYSVVLSSLYLGAGMLLAWSIGSFRQRSAKFHISKNWIIIGLQFALLHHGIGFFVTSGEEFYDFSVPVYAISTAISFLFSLPIFFWFLHNGKDVLELISNFIALSDSKADEKRAIPESSNNRGVLGYFTFLSSQLGSWLIFGLFVLMGIGWSSGFLQFENYHWNMGQLTKPTFWLYSISVFLPTFLITAIGYDMHIQFTSSSPESFSYLNFNQKRGAVIAASLLAFSILLILTIVWTFFFFGLRKAYLVSNPGESLSSGRSAIWELAQWIKIAGNGGEIIFWSLPLVLALSMIGLAQPVNAILNSWWRSKKLKCEKSVNTSRALTFGFSLGLFIISGLILNNAAFILPITMTQLIALSYNIGIGSTLPPLLIIWLSKKKESGNGVLMTSTIIGSFVFSFALAVMVIWLTSQFDWVKSNLLWVEMCIVLAGIFGGFIGFFLSKISNVKNF